VLEGAVQLLSLLTEAGSSDERRHTLGQVLQPGVLLPLTRVSPHPPRWVLPASIHAVGGSSMAPATVLHIFRGCPVLAVSSAPLASATTTPISAALAFAPGLHLPFATAASGARTLTKL
jgi:hypothetical protein